MSRFDLMWLLLDRPDSDSDTALAHHVLHVHREGMPPVRIPEFRMISYLTLKSQELSFTPISSTELQSYISYSRKFKPHIPIKLTDYISGQYAELRAEEKEAGENSMVNTKQFSYTAQVLIFFIRVIQLLELYYQFFVYLKQLHAYDGAIK